MDQHAHDPDSHSRPHRRGRAITVAVAMSALLVACISGIEDDDEDLGFREGCDGAEEYIDENGEMVICVYTDEPGDGGGGGDPCWYFPWLCYPGGDDGGDGGDGGDDGGGDGGGGGELPPACYTTSEAYFTPSGGTPSPPGTIALLATLPDPGGTTPFDLWRATQLAPLLQQYQSAGCPPGAGLELCTWQPNGTIRCRFTLMPAVPAQCSDTQPCPGQHEQCIGGQCILDLCADVTCDADRYCDPGSGQCVPSAGCVLPSDCPSGTYCQAGLCIPGCQSNWECPNDLVCVDHQCVEGCGTPLDCAPGMYCQTETGQCQPGCQTWLDCGPGNYCATPGWPEIGQCMPGCDSSADCDPGEFCEPSSHQCQPGCSISSPCSPGSYCDYDSGQCLPGCNTSLDCGDDQYCEPTTHQCMPGCGSDKDCDFPQVCEFGQCVDGPSPTW